MKSLLLIGGTGSIGQGLVSYLSKLYELTVVSSKEFPLPKIDYKGDFDIVVDCAGISLLNDLSLFHLLNRKIIDVHCMGALNILAHFLPGMRGRKYGRIIFISSVCSAINLREHGVYSATKAFIDKLVKIAAIENGQYRITVNSIQLGYTGMGMSVSTDDNMKRQIYKTALRRYCTMQELSNAITFIVNTEYFTGQNLRLDGGIA